MSWQRVASTADLEAAHPWLAVRVGRIDIAIAQIGGTPFAVEDRCTHAGCPFSEDADLIEDVISCNCHGSEFDIRTGDVQRGPAEYPVRTFPARVVGEDVELDVQG
jgi:nitrite reductase/ring-hydroxylating ferredoxin subunit